MARKPASAPADTETTLTVQVLDTLNRDGADYGPGAEIDLPQSEAVKLRTLGVVAFDDAAPAV